MVAIAILAVPAVCMGFLWLDTWRLKREAAAHGIYSRADAIRLIAEAHADLIGR